MSAALKLTAATATEQRLLDYLTANASEALAAKIAAGKKTLAGAVKHATEEARKIAAQGAACVCIEDATVFGWVIHYFEEDSIAEPKAAPAVRTAAPVVKAPRVSKRYNVKAKEKELRESARKPAGPVQLDLLAALLGVTPE